MAENMKLIPIKSVQQLYTRQLLPLDIKLAKLRSVSDLALGPNTVPFALISRTYRLAGADNLQRWEVVTLISLLLKLMSIYLSANSSLALSPVTTSSRTIVRSRTPRALSSDLTSSISSTAGIFFRVALWRTH